MAKTKNKRQQKKSSQVGDAHESSKDLRVWQKNLCSLPGKTILFIAAVVLLFFLNLLLSGDSLERFTLLCGLEILLAIVIAWAVFFLRRKKDSEEDQENDC